MDALIALWLPILISTVVVFFASFVLWTISPHHKGDYKKLPNEDDLLKTVRASGEKSGVFMFPMCEWKDMKDPEVKARYDRGPHGYVTLWPGQPNMLKNMVLSAILYLIISIFIAYVVSVVFAGRTAPVEYLEVFRIAGTVGVMAYCFGSIGHDIWFGKPRRAMFMEFFDGVVYALLTAGVFAWLARSAL